MPDSFKDETGDTFHENVNIAANTAVFLSGLGMPYEMTEDDAVKAQELFENVAKHKASPKPSSELTQTGSGACLVRLSKGVRLSCCV
jgi:hypothetical protein